MTQLVGDVANRVRRLPKPSNIGDGLQPIFEAVSNGIHAIFDLYKDKAKDHGQVFVTFSNIKEPLSYSVSISDNGIGLDSTRFRAFCTTDTPFKIERGGKGVGRLLWLDAFRLIHVESIFEEHGQRIRREFDFSLDGDEPIYNEKIEDVSAESPLGTAITMSGLRSNSYATAMPVQFAAIKKHFGSHFMADFLLGNTPQVIISHEGDDIEFPSAIDKVVVERKKQETLESELFGELKIDGYMMNRQASSDLDGNHQLHLVSSGRTVQTRKIDGLLGVGRLGDSGENVFHACVAGRYLDERVNQERTQFNFGEEVAQELSRECADKIKGTMLKAEYDTYENYRLEKVKGFIEEYPSFGFEAPQTLLTKMPVSADSDEAFASALIKHKIRADRDRRTMVQSVIDRLVTGGEIAPNLSAEIRQAAEEASADENRQLMECVIRRKFIIEILDALLGKVRVMSDSFDTHVEKTFHQLMCPMQIVGDNPSKSVPATHDLWLLDERLAPAVYFASDARTEDFIEDGDTDRVDLMVWDRIHGLGLGETDRLSRVLLVELKKPERASYKGATSSAGR